MYIIINTKTKKKHKKILTYRKKYLKILSILVLLLIMIQSDKMIYKFTPICITDNSNYFLHLKIILQKFLSTKGYIIKSVLG